MIFKKRFLSKLLSGALSFNLIFQQLFWIGLAFSAVPAYAEEPTVAVEPISFDRNSNSFTFPVDDGKIVNYLFAYRTDKAQAEVVLGQAQPIYAGTCSEGGNCVDHEVLHGILKTKAENAAEVNTVRFALDHDQLVIVSQATVSGLELSDEENSWLENFIYQPAASPSPTPIPSPSASAAPILGETASINPSPSPALTETDSSPPVLGVTTVTLDSSLLLPLDLGVTEVFGSATLTTDKPDYAPTEIVLITGTGFNPGENYTLVISSNDEPAVRFETTVTADASGNFVYAYQLDGNYRPNYLVETFLAETFVTSVTFTDSSIGTYDQCSNDTGAGYASGDLGCHWINGNLQQTNSAYYEGDSTVQRLWLTGFTPGSSHSVTLKYGTTKGGKHAYDYLTNWDFSENWVTLADRCQDITGCTSVSETTTSIPNDPNTEFTSGQLVNPVPQPAGRVFTMRGGSLTGASVPSLTSGAYSGDSETLITVSFTVDASGAMCETQGQTTTCGAVLWFGAHVAKSSEWASGGAGSISGSPYHVSLEAVDGGAAGSRDNQMAANAIVSLGSITIIKDAVPNDAQNFTFTTTGTGLSGFNLDDDSDPTLPNTQTFTGLSAGSYSITEGAMTGWSLTSAVCLDNATGGQVASGNGATIALAPGQNITCTFTNTQQNGTLTVNKILSPSQDPGLFNLQIDGQTQAANVGNGGTTGAISVSPGSHTVGETAGTSTNLANYTTVIGGDCSADGTVNVPAGTSKTCTVTNTRNAGTLTVHKQVDTNGDGVYEVTTDTDANILGFLWGLDGETSLRSFGTSQTGVTTNAIHTVSENSVPGYHYVMYFVGSASCEGTGQGTLPATFSIPNDSQSYDREVTLCNSRDTGNIVGTKFNDRNGDGGQGQGEELLAGWTFDLKDQAGNILQTVVSTVNGFTFTNVPTGSYLVCERPQDGWAQTAPVNNGCWGVTLSTNEQLPTSADFGNVQLGRIIVEKQTLPDQSGQSFAFTSSYDRDGFSLTDGQQNDSGYLNPGTYSVSETAIEGWDLTSAICSDQSPIGAISLQAGETVTCTFTNTQRGSISGYKLEDGIQTPLQGWVIELWQWIEQILDYSFTGQTDTTDVLGAFSFNDLLPGVYQLREQLQGGWTKITPAGTGIEVTLTPGETDQNNNFVNFENTSISGYKFYDVNGNGTWDEGELPLDGWIIDLTGSANASVVTGAGDWPDGYYEFTNLGPGSYNVTEELHTGWTQTTSPASYNETLASGTPLTNRNFGNRGNLQITACKYEDLNGLASGVQGPGVTNWNFTIGQTTQNTGEGNCASFDNLVPGTYDVSELPIPDGWHIADDSQGSRRVVLADSNQTVNFYNYRNGTVSGAKWDDVNANGVFEDEPMLSSWHIQLFENNDGVKGAQVGDDAVTNTDGNYAFTAVAPGNYFVCESQQLGWSQTYPNLDSDYPNCHEITVTSNGEVADKDFGNFRPGQIYGFKYEDTDGDGYWDEGEFGIEDWQICLNGEDCTYTDGDGYFEFTSLAYGDYTLTEDESNPDYQRTQPTSDSYNIHIESGSGFGEGDVRYFGNAPLSDIHGYKWNDEDEDTERGEGEDLLGGWTIFLDEDGDEELDEGEGFTTTGDGTQSDDFGIYRFFDLLPGDYSICEVRQDGWNQTYPFGYLYDEETDDEYPTYCHNITVPNDDQQYNFGNQPVNPTLIITKANNAAGDKTPGDSVLFTITVTASDSAVLNAQVTDLPAGGFTYQAGTWTANSSVYGAISIPEPVYASPGVWNLGDMEEGETITLTYLAQISGSQAPGLYTDLAWAQGESLIGADVLAMAENPGFIDTNFAGTQVKVVADDHDNLTLVGQVLGASTELPSTGAQTLWLIIALTMIVGGAGSIKIGSKLKKEI